MSVVGCAVRSAVLAACVAVLVACAGDGAQDTTSSASAASSAVPSSVPATPGRPAPDGEPGDRTHGGIPAVVAHGPADRHRIALTFDSNMTDSMLRRLDSGRVSSYANVAVIDELQAQHVPATFFLAGKWVERYPDLTRRIAADPRFEIASHSYSHRGFTPRCYGLDPIPASAMAADVDRSFSVLAPFGGHQTRYFRFPGGCYDATALRAIAPTRATVIQYDDVGDDPFNDDTAAITAGVLRQAHDGAIVVLHITKANAPRTADALPKVIDGLLARGYQLVTLSDLLDPPPPQH